MAKKKFDVLKVIKKLKKFDDAFFNTDKPKVSDEEYDALREKLEAELPKLKGEEKKAAKTYLASTGAPVKKSKARTSKRDVILPFFISSLRKLKADDIKGMAAWFKKLFTVSKAFPKERRKYVALVSSPKLDGISLTLKYKKGKLVDAYTRGNGKEGQSKLKHAKCIPTIPHNLNNKKTVYVRGELVASKRQFKALTKKYPEKYKVLLASCSGWINADEPNLEFATCLTFVAHDVRNSILMEGGYKEPEKQTKANLLSNYDGKFTTILSLECNNRPTTIIKVVKPDDVEKYIEFCKTELEKFKADLDYPVDGLVIETNDFYFRTKLGYSSDNRPEYSKAFKFSAEQDAVRIGMTTEVTGFDIKHTKDGAMVPTILFNPVKIGNNNVKRASGANFQNLVKKQIGIGSIIKVVKAGDVVPKAMLHMHPKKEKHILPKECACGSKAVHTSAHSYCSKPLKCEFTKRALFEYTLKKTKLTGLGVKTVNALFKAKVQTLPDLLSVKENTLLKIPGFGNSMVVTLKQELPKKIKAMSEAELMELSGLFSRPGFSIAAKTLSSILEGTTTEGEAYDLYRSKKKEFKEWKATIKPYLK